MGRCRFAQCERRRKLGWLAGRRDSTSTTLRSSPGPPADVNDTHQLLPVAGTRLSTPDAAFAVFYLLETNAVVKVPSQMHRSVLYWK